MLPETRAWTQLLALSALSTVLAVAATGQASRFAAWGQVALPSALLGLAWLKARLILASYLGLSQAPAWLRGFGLVLAVFVAALLVLALLPMLNPMGKVG